MVTKNTFGVLFFTRKHRGKEGKTSIYDRITVDGKCTELSVKLSVDVKSWNSSNGKAKGSGEEIKSINTMLEQIRCRIVECYQEIKLRRLISGQPHGGDLFCSRLKSSNIFPIHHNCSKYRPVFCFSEFFSGNP